MLIATKSVHQLHPMLLSRRLRRLVRDQVLKFQQDEQRHVDEKPSRKLGLFWVLKCENGQWHVGAEPFLKWHLLMQKNDQIYYLHVEWLRVGFTSLIRVKTVLISFHSLQWWRPPFCNQRTVLFILLVCALGGFFGLEQPDGSTLEFYPAFRAMLAAVFGHGGDQAVRGWVEIKNTRKTNVDEQLPS